MIIIKRSNLDQAAGILNKGGVGVIPTDTVYGLVCKANLKTAVERLYSLKDRTNNPGPVIAESTHQLIDLGIKPRYIKPIEHYWPNPISIEIPHDISYLNQRTGSQAFRVVKDELLSGLFSLTGPLLTSSANLVR